MDEYVTGATHLIMVSEPLERIGSMYYYESLYTKLKDRMPGDVEVGPSTSAPLWPVNRAARNRLPSATVGL